MPKYKVCKYEIERTEYFCYDCSKHIDDYGYCNACSIRRRKEEELEFERQLKWFNLTLILNNPRLIIYNFIK